MKRPTDPAKLTPVARAAELAALLAEAYLRLRAGPCPGGAPSPRRASNRWTRQTTASPTAGPEAAP